MSNKALDVLTPSSTSKQVMDAVSAISLLNTIGEKDAAVLPSKKVTSNVCMTLLSIASSSKEQQITQFAAVRGYLLLKCDTSAISDSFLKYLGKSLKKASSDDELIEAIRTAALLNKIDNKSIKETLTALVEGTENAASKSKALFALVELLKVTNEKSSGLKESFGKKLVTYVKLQGSLGGEDRKENVLSLGDGLSTTSRFLFSLLYLNGLSDSVSLPPKVISSLTEFVVLAKITKSVQSAELIYLALSAASNNGNSIPVSVVVTSPLMFSSGAYDTLVVSVSNALGQPLQGSVSLISASLNGKTVANNIPFKENSIGNLQLAGVSKTVGGNIGSYELDILATVPGISYLPLDSITVKATVLDNPKSLIKSASVKVHQKIHDVQPGKKVPEKLNLDPSSTITFSVVLISHIHQGKLVCAGCK
jgi:hypothetical protein